MKLTKVVNVFQKNYCNAKGNGFGDFLRGTIFMLQVANKYNLEFDIDYNNHMISKFLTKNNNTTYDINYNNVPFIEGCWKGLNHHQYNDFIKYLESTTDDILYLYNNNGPLYQITYEQSNYLKNKLIPNEELTISINKTMEILNIIEKQYKTIHIRTGDRFILHNNIDYELFERIYQIIASKIDINDKLQKYCILSDSNELKKMLKDKNPNFIICINDITHLGEDNNNELETTKNTLIDFFILSKSNYIYGLSVYEHGTGFSKQCSMIFNIDYDFALVQDYYRHPTR
jgi:hypothetical protein